ncbi:MAG: proton-translocating NADH-quinone oxidoreductase subunit, partial [Proteobacteria bacterium]|nr:proton-translocating NADH-quinone oxidoreductase subunit [Pseudomonadota bacterium]
MQTLSFILWAPFFGAVLVALLPAAQPRLIRAVALFHAGLALALAWSLIAAFDRTTAAIQFVEQVVWSPALGVSYALGVDGLSLPMVLLATLLALVALLASASVITRVKGYYAWMLILEFAMLGVFMAQDWTLFFMFWELTLIPLFFLIDLWGGEKRHAASLSFVLYTMGGAIFILIGLIMAYRSTPTPSFAMAAIAQAAASLPRDQQVLLLLAFLIGFGVKIPIFPLHGWL